MSFFVSFEGVDGCGKTTQVELLRSRLESAGANVLVTREPGGTVLAEMLRASILTSDVRLDAPAELLLFAAARAQHVLETIRPALNRGHVVLCDRFADSSLAYQGAGLGLDRSFIEQLNRFATGGLEPHVTFLLDIDPDIGWQRRETQRGKTRSETQRASDETAFQNAAALSPSVTNTSAARGEEDRIERRGVEFQRRVRAAFLDLARATPARIAVLDASSPAKIVHNRIVRELEKRGLFQFSKPERHASLARD